MILRKVIEKCAKDVGFEDCSECVYSDYAEECFNCVSTYVHPKKCRYCDEKIYLCNGMEIEEIDNKYCPMCGRSLKI